MIFSIKIVEKMNDLYRISLIEKIKLKLLG
jgi:hypothetical protein